MYDLIYADPPWEWKAFSEKGEEKSAKKHYQIMSLSDIKNLPVESLANDNSVLLMWAVDPLLDKAFEVIESWGFKFKTVGFYWIKENKKSPGFFTGCGYYTRANPEICLLATKGKGLQRIRKDVKRLVVSPRGKHSEKPPEIRDRIVDLFGDVKRIELFSRTKTNGWDVWGNEVASDVFLENNSYRISWQ